MPLEGFEPSIPAVKRLQTYALDRTARCMKRYPPILYFYPKTGVLFLQISVPLLDVVFREECTNIRSMRWTPNGNSHCASEIGCLRVYCSEPVSNGKQWSGLLRTVSLFDNNIGITIDCSLTFTVISCWQNRTETSIPRNEKNWKLQAKGDAFMRGQCWL